jgi:predicted dehydrogenase
MELIALTRREDAKNTVDDNYENKDCSAYNDFRKIIQRKDIDAVCIATPDHWHAIPPLAALKSGKDVYCEKPLTHNIHEALEVMKAVDANKRVLQTGSMQRSMKEFRVACELVRNGVIGKIKYVRVGFGHPPVPCDLPEEKMEPGLDWNMWVGPAQMRPYNSILSPRGLHDKFPRWRLYKEFGGGMVCDWGAHHFDIAQWGLGRDNSGPIEIKPLKNEKEETTASLLYDDGITVIHNTKRVYKGVRFFGSKGEVYVDRGAFQFKLNKKTIADKAKKDRKVSLAAELQKVEKGYLKNAKVKLYNSKNHIWDFLDCVESRKKPITNEQVGGRTVLGCHLLNLAYLNKQKIQWDPKKLQFKGKTGNPKWFTRDYRSPWKV